MLTCKLNPEASASSLWDFSRWNINYVQNRFPPEAYQGALSTVGLDVGITAGGVLGWAVFAPTVGLPVGALAGEYVGASGDIGLGIGVGANVLVGGSGRTVALQPVSVEGSIAVNLALGVSWPQIAPCVLRLYQAMIVGTSNCGQCSILRQVMPRPDANNPERIAK